MADLTDDTKYHTRYERWARGLDRTMNLATPQELVEYSARVTEKLGTFHCEWRYAFIPNPEGAEDWMFTVTKSQEVQGLLDISPGQWFYHYSKLQDTLPEGSRSNVCLHEMKRSCLRFQHGFLCFSCHKCYFEKSLETRNKPLGNLFYGPLTLEEPIEQQPVTQEEASQKKPAATTKRGIEDMFYEEPVEVAPAGPHTTTTKMFHNRHEAWAAQLQKATRENTPKELVMESQQFPNPHWKYEYVKWGSSPDERTAQLCSAPNWQFCVAMDEEPEYLSNIPPGWWFYHFGEEEGVTEKRALDLFPGDDEDSKSRRQDYAEAVYYKQYPFPAKHTKDKSCLRFKSGFHCFSCSVTYFEREGASMVEPQVSAKKPKAM